MLFCYRRCMLYCIQLLIQHTIGYNCIQLHTITMLYFIQLYSIMHIQMLLGFFATDTFMLQLLTITYDCIQLYTCAYNLFMLCNNLYMQKYLCNICTCNICTFICTYATICTCLYTIVHAYNCVQLQCCIACNCTQLCIYRCFYAFLLQIYTFYILLTNAISPQITNKEQFYIAIFLNDKLKKHYSSFYGLQYSKM